MPDFFQGGSICKVPAATRARSCGLSPSRAFVSLFLWRGQHDKRFFFYSCTKPVTVVAALRLWERGELALDAPVAEYLPSYAHAYTMENGVRKKQTMRVRHLFTMTSGLNYNLNAPAIAEGQEAAQSYDRGCRQYLCGRAARLRAR